MVSAPEAVFEPDQTAGSAAITGVFVS